MAGGGGTNFGGVDVVPLLGAIAGVYAGIIWGHPKTVSFLGSVGKFILVPAII